MDQHSSRVLEFPHIRTLLQTHCLTSLGSTFINKLKPHTERNRAEHQHDLMEDMSVFLENKSLPGLILHVCLHLPEGADKPGASLSKMELFQIFESIESSQKLFSLSFGDTRDFPHLASYLKSIPDLSDVLKAFRTVFDTDGHIRDSASPELKIIRNQIIGTRLSINQTVEKIRSMRGMSSCVEGAAEPVLIEGRHMIRLLSSCRNRFKGIVHSTSASGRSVYFEPDSLIRLNNRMGELSRDEESEISRIMQKLTASIGQEKEFIVSALQKAGKIDVTYAFLSYARSTNSVRPSFHDEGRIFLDKARHPLIPDCIPMDIRLEPPSRFLIISGPNAGGKTVGLKITGLLSMMAQCGLYLPAASGSCLPWFSDILLDIGDEQSIEHSLSTFSAHLTNLKRIIDQAAPDTLVLLDEPGVGTEPEFGELFAWNYLLTLKELGLTGIATTHYRRIKTLALNDPAFRNASVDYDTENLRPLFRILYDIPGDSNPIPLMRNLGFPESLINHIKNSGDKGEASGLTGLIKDLSEKKREQETVESRLSDRERVLTNMERKADLKYREYKKKEKALKREFRDSITGFIKQGRSRFEKLIREITEKGRSGSRIKEAHELFSELEKYSKGLEDIPENRPAFIGSFFKGDTVLVRGKDYGGTVISLKGDKAVLQTDVARITIPLRDLEPAEKKESSSVSFKAPPSEPVERELNIIGLRATVAQKKLENFYDRILLSDLSHFRIVHGRGSGTLRTLVRDFLKIKKSEDEIKSYGPAPAKEGGEGCTIIDR